MQHYTSCKPDYYFAHPYSSWERGVNENTNGLLRQFLPKGGRFEEVTERDLKRAKEMLNRRPSYLHYIFLTIIGRGAGDAVKTRGY